VAAAALGKVSRFKAHGSRSVWDSQVFLFIDFLIEQRTIHADYYSKLHKDPIKLAFRSKRQGASAHRRCNNRNIGGNALGGTATPCL
jgi:hypothetical protein